VQNIRNKLRTEISGVDFNRFIDGNAKYTQKVIEPFLLLLLKDPDDAPHFLYFSFRNRQFIDDTCGAGIITVGTELDILFDKSAIQRVTRFLATKTV
jgi:hypothetical protein